MVIWHVLNKKFIRIFLQIYCYRSFPIIISYAKSFKTYNITYFLVKKYNRGSILSDFKTGEPNPKNGKNKRQEL
jgi:hypothetical protein